jgi:hypothetical protein
VACSGRPAWPLGVVFQPYCPLLHVPPAFTPSRFPSRYHGLSHVPGWIEFSCKLMATFSMWSQRAATPFRPPERLHMRSESHPLLLNS